MTNKYKKINADASLIEVIEAIKKEYFKVHGLKISDRQASKLLIEKRYFKL